MEKEERDELIRYRLEQAEVLVATVIFEIKHEQWLTAVNRLYYGLYHALTALALRNEFKTSHHAQLIGWFNREFVATGKIDSETGKFLREAYKNRMKGDYDAFVRFSAEQVKEMLPGMQSFIDKIKQLVTV